MNFLLKCISHELLLWKWHILNTDQTVSRHKRFKALPLHWQWTPASPYFGFHWWVYTVSIACFPFLHCQNVFILYLICSFAFWTNLAHLIIYILASHKALLFVYFDQTNHFAGGSMRATDKVLVFTCGVIPDWVGKMLQQMCIWVKHATVCVCTVALRCSKCMCNFGFITHFCVCVCVHLIYNKCACGCQRQHIALCLLPLSVILSRAR